MAVTRSTSAKKVVSKAVAVKVTNSSGGKHVSWDDRYNQLFALSEKEGHCRPHHSTTLGKWCKQQRTNFNGNNRVLYQYQIDKLIEIDFQFCLYNKTPKKRLVWIDCYNDLVDYKNEHGHASPPVSEGQLGRWCKDQRSIFQDKFRSTGKATMYQYQIGKLIEIDFQFNLQKGGSMQQRAWIDRYNDLVDYKNEHGHTNPPAREGRPTQQRANLPARPDLQAWSDMPALPEMPTLPDMQTLSSLAILPDCANLPTRPDLQAWSDMPALPEMPTLPDMQTLSSLAILPDCVLPVPNVIAV
jgi:hypothetical protein